MPRSRKPVLTVVGVFADPAWLTWYNRASAGEQNDFDNFAKFIDRGDKLDAAWFQNAAQENAGMRHALEDYRDTGGRRALFGKTKDYGATPITAVRSGGPLEDVRGVVTLHPGRYSYTLTAKDGPAFIDWLKKERATGNLSIGRYQVSEANFAGEVELVLFGDKPASEMVLGPYYTDYEIRVWKDTPWSSSVKGLPTWLPDGYSLEKYWGKPTEPAKPDWHALDPAWDFGKTMLTLVIVAGAVYLLGELRPRQIARA